MTRLRIPHEIGACDSAHHSRFPARLRCLNALPHQVAPHVSFQIGGRHARTHLTFHYDE